MHAEKLDSLLYFCPMIVVTGALGFIGSALLGDLERAGYGSLVAVDDFSHSNKFPNLENKNISQRVERELFFEWLSENARFVQCIFHIGARTRTNEFDWDVLNHLNVHYSQKLWQMCSQENIPLIYASSAATYGNGSEGFSDRVDGNQLIPLNPYGQSKHIFDLWVEEQLIAGIQPPFWAGFKFFNVFGPNEYHKDRMASVVFHAFHQIQETGKMKLFKSYREDYPDGAQRRDFVYIKDVTSVLIYFMESRKHSALYNLGSGESHTFKELAEAVFEALDFPAQIEYVDMPEDIRDNYQYFTQAEMSKVRSAGYETPFWDFSESVKDYVQGYLMQKEAKKSYL